jgi:hypothetical protein
MLGRLVVGRVVKKALIPCRRDKIKTHHFVSLERTKWFMGRITAADSRTLGCFKPCQGQSKTMESKETRVPHGDAPQSVPQF